MIELKVIDDLVNNTKKVFCGFHCRHYGDNKPTAVIVGESHSDIFETPLGRCFQENLIRKFRPKYVLIETLTKCDENKLSECIEKNICFKRWRDKHQCELKPCDLSAHEMAEKMREILNGYPNLSVGLEYCYSDQQVISHYQNQKTYNRDLEQLIYDAREIKMGEIIIDCSKNSTTPIIAIVGNWHSRYDSKIHETLKGHINYVCIWNEEWMERTRRDKANLRHKKI